MVDADSAPLEQIVKQLNKLINVIKITELDPVDSVQRELMLIAVRCTVTNRRDIIDVVQIFNGRVLDMGHTAVTFSVDARPDRLDTLEGLLRPYGIIDVQRTGRVALPKLADSSETK